MCMDDAGQSATTEATSGSKNIIIIAIVVVLLLLGAGIYYVLGKSMHQGSEMVKHISPVTPTPKDAFASIQDALAKSMSLRCDYTDTTGKKVITYIKSGVIRADVSGQVPSANGSVIMKDKKMYFWNGKQGFVMTFDMGGMMAGTAAAAPSMMQKPSSAPIPDGSSLMKNLETYKKYCKVATVDDTLFIIPTDVVFTDMSKTMPGGAGVPSSMTPEQIKAMQQQSK